MPCSGEAVENPPALAEGKAAAQSSLDKATAAAMKKMGARDPFIDNVKAFLLFMIVIGHMGMVWNILTLGGNFMVTVWSPQNPMPQHWVQVRCGRQR